MALSQGNKTALQDIFIEQIHGIHKDIYSKTFDKGKHNEQDGITILQKALYPGRLLLKNKERKTDDYFNGEADVIVDDIIYDVKNAYSLYTFEKAELSSDYYYQLLAYCMLYVKTKARLFYVLTDTPEHLLISEERKIFYSNSFADQFDDEYIEMCENMRMMHVFGDKPIEERFKMWDVELTEDLRTAMLTKLDKCREYLVKLDKERTHGIERNRELIKSAKE